jgi:hypothetical protein
MTKANHGRAQATRTLSLASTWAVLACLTFSLNAYAQTADLDMLFADRPEVFFEFTAPDAASFELASHLVSVDHGHDGSLTTDAYANRSTFERFLTLGLPYTLKTSPGEQIVAPNMKTLADMAAELPMSYCLDTWDAYPTYGAYEAMMLQFATDHPGICSYEDIGTLPSGRKILAVRISDNIGTDEGEPGVLYTSTMHGDETAGYPLALRLIAYLLCNYGSDPEVDFLVNNLDIWINPLANPDGMYRFNDNSISGATRGNLSGVDLNRNFPDPQDGPHPDGLSYQPETTIFMNLADNEKFVISSNWHGGAEVANYPWDTWSRRTADDDWWRYVMRNWADTVQAVSPSSYFDFRDNGITNGWDWYEVDGGRQDYMNYWKECREFTLEISNSKTPSGSNLPSFWDRQYQAMLNYLKEALNGFNGTVTDAVTGAPIMDAEIFITGHDEDGSQVTSRYTGGKYYRPIKEGSYNLSVSAPGYVTQTVSGVSVLDGAGTVVDIALVPSGAAVCNAPVGLNSTVLGPNNVNISWSPVAGAQGYQVKGRVVGTSGFGQLQTTSTSRTVNGLLSGTTYEWQIRMMCADGSISAFSPFETFTTSTLREAAPEMEIYPIPASTSLVVEGAAEGLVELLDMTGRTVASANNGFGFVRFDVSDLPSGLYVVRTQKGQQTALIE